MRHGPAASVASGLPTLRRDDRLHLDLDEELGADEPGDPDHRGRRAHVGEVLAVGAADIMLVALDVDDVHARPHDVGERRADGLERPLDALERRGGLGVRAFRRTPVGADAERARHVDDVADSHGAVVPDPGLERGVGGVVAALAHAFAATRASSAALTCGQSSSITLYQAESRRWPPRTSMCLRKTPSNWAGRAASAARERSLPASVLNSTRRQPSRSKAWPSRSSFASVFAPLPQASGTIQLQPISSTRSSGRTAR